MSASLARVSPAIRWLRFNAVGIVGFALQLALLKALVVFMRLDAVIASTLAVEAAIIHNFLWHDRFTWRERKGTERFTRLLRFNFSNGAVSLAGNAVMMWLLADELQLNFLIANAIAVACCSFVNFVIADRWAFAARRAPSAKCFGA